MEGKVSSTSSVTTTQKFWSSWKQSEKWVQHGSEHWHWLRVAGMLVREIPGENPHGKSTWRIHMENPQGSSPRTSQGGCASDRNLSPLTNPPWELLAQTSPEQDPFTRKTEFVRMIHLLEVIITQIFSDYQFQRLKVLKKNHVRWRAAHETTESRNQSYLLAFASTSPICM